MATANLNNPNRRRVVAVMYRAKSKDVIMTRHYAYFDTAMPRMLQLAITYCNEGDFIQFSSAEFGHELGVLYIRKGGRFEMEMSPLVKASPSLLKLMSEDTTRQNPLVTAALKKARS